MAGDGPGGWQETNLIPAKESGLHPADGAVEAIEGHDAEGRADSDLASWGDCGGDRVDALEGETRSEGWERLLQ